MHVNKQGTAAVCQKNLGSASVAAARAGTKKYGSEAQNVLCATTHTAQCVCHRCSSTVSVPHAHHVRALCHNTHSEVCVPIYEAVVLQVCAGKGQQTSLSLHTNIVVKRVSIKYPILVPARTDMVVGVEHQSSNQRCVCEKSIEMMLCVLCACEKQLGKACRGQLLQLARGPRSNQTQ